MTTQMELSVEVKTLADAHELHKIVEDFVEKRNAANAENPVDKDGKKLKEIANLTEHPVLVAALKKRDSINHEVQDKSKVLTSRLLKTDCEIERAKILHELKKQARIADEGSDSFWHEVALYLKSKGLIEKIDADISLSPSRNIFYEGHISHEKYESPFLDIKKDLEKFEESKANKSEDAPDDFVIRISEDPELKKYFDEREACLLKIVSKLQIMESVFAKAKTAKDCLMQAKLVKDVFKLQRETMKIHSSFWFSASCYLKTEGLIKSLDDDLCIGEGDVIYAGNAKAVLSESDKKISSILKRMAER